jgi:hypothetical protein
VLTLTDLLDYWEATGRMAPEQIAAARAFWLGAANPCTAPCAR